MRQYVLLAGWLGLLAVGNAQAQVTILDDFEGSKGHFNLQPTFSGTSAGLLTSSNTVLDTTTPAFTGTSSLQVNIFDDTAVLAPDGSAWRVRLLSGSGTPSNNVNLANSATSFVGFYMRSTTPGLRLSLMLDDGTALERATIVPAISDGNWHLYEWNLADAASWDAFAGTGANGQIDAALVTIDSIWIDSPSLGGGAQDAVFNLDYVAFNPSGSIAPVPEPSTMALVGVAGIGFAVRRLRRKK